MAKTTFSGPVLEGKEGVNIETKASNYTVTTGDSGKHLFLKQTELYLHYQQLQLVMYLSLQTMHLTEQMLLQSVQMHLMESLMLVHQQMIKI